MAALMHSSLAQVTNYYLITLFVIHAQTNITHDILIFLILVDPNVSKGILWVDYQLLWGGFIHFLRRLFWRWHFFDYSFGELNLFIDSSLDTFALTRLLHSLGVNLHSAT